MSRTLTAADRSALIRLASTMPKGDTTRRAILAGLERIALEFASEAALKKYLKEHPNADRKNHTVKSAPPARPVGLLKSVLPAGLEEFSEFSREMNDDEIFDFSSTKVLSAVARVIDNLDSFANKVWGDPDRIREDGVDEALEDFKNGLEDVAADLDAIKQEDLRGEDLEESLEYAEEQFKKVWTKFQRDIKD